MSRGADATRTRDLLRDRATIRTLPDRESCTTAGMSPSLSYLSLFRVNCCIPEIRIRHERNREAPSMMSAKRVPTDFSCRWNPRRYSTVEFRFTWVTKSKNFLLRCNSARWLCERAVGFNWSRRRASASEKSKAPPGKPGGAAQTSGVNP